MIDRLIAARALAALCAVALLLDTGAGRGVARADFTPIFPPAPIVLPEPTLDVVDTAGDGTDGVLDFLYGLGNLRRVDDDFDQKWQLTQPTASAATVANFSIATMSFGVLPDSAEPFHEFFEVDSDVDFPVVDPRAGYLNVGGSLTGIDASQTGTIFELALLQTSMDLSQDLYSSRESRQEPPFDQMVTYEIIGDTGHPGNEIGNYVVGWNGEPSFDLDYQDAVIELSGLAPANVPEPSAGLLVGGLLLLLTAAASAGRRRRSGRS